MVAEGGEGENPLPFSLTAPKRGGGVGGGGGRGGYPGFVSLESFVGKRPQAPGGPGPKPWGPGPQAPWRPGQAPGAWIPPLSLTSCKPSTSGSQNATITPNPLTLGGVGWFPKAELYSSMRGHWAGPLACIPVKNSKNAPVLIGS